MRHVGVVLRDGVRQDRAFRTMIILPNLEKARGIVKAKLTPLQRGGGKSTTHVDLTEYEGSTLTIVASDLT